MVCNRTSGADTCSTLGGIIPHFYRFFGIFKFWLVYSGINDFSGFKDFFCVFKFWIFGVYSCFNENLGTICSFLGRVSNSIAWDKLSRF